MGSENFEPESARLIDKMLAFAFQMWLEQMRDRSLDYLQKRAEVCSKVIAEKGDVLMYGSKTKGAAGDAFNRLAEGMACLVLITKQPVPFGKLVFNHTGKVEFYETEEKANERVWPEKVLKVQEDVSGDPLQPEEVQTVCEDSSQMSLFDDDAGADQGSKGDDR